MYFYMTVKCVYTTTCFSIACKVTRMEDKARELLVSRIQQRCEALGITINAASERAGSPSLIPNIIYGRSKHPRLDTLERLADALETSTAYLTGLADDPTADERSDLTIADVAAPSRSDETGNIPVLGTAAGSLIETADGHAFEGFEIESRVVQYVKRPPALEHVKDAYSFFVDGDSMHPMHPPGELRFANPHMTVSPGDTVVVQTRTWADKPGQAYIKIYRRRAGGFLVLEQINPPATISIPQQYVLSVHKVLSTNELFSL